MNIIKKQIAIPGKEKMLTLIKIITTIIMIIIKQIIFT